ncbi:hypothetical protein MAR_018168, partial [Mya arenaria]
MWSIWFIVAQAIPGIILGQVCPPELPVASMCVAGTVRGSSVALDISGAAGNGAETCTCAALATSSGVTVDIIAALKDVNCGTTLSILFKEKSIKTICGGSATHVSTGNSAFITYTRNLLIENPNSNYCITFASDRNDTTFTLTCTTPPTTTTKLPTQPQNTTISAQPETTISPGHQNITTTLGSLTTLSPPSTSVVILVPLLAVVLIGFVAVATYIMCKRRNDSLLNTTQNGKPKAYEPNDRERDLMASLELSTINFESDPSDTNRYFKKEDPGDWYRVVMKGKKPKSSKSARKYKSNDKDHGKGKHRHRSRTKESSGHRSKRRSKSRSDSDGDYLASDSSNAKKSKSSTATSDSLKDSYSSKFGGTQSNEDRTESQAENRKDSKSMSSNPRLIQSQPVPVIHSKPVSEPKFVQSQSANKTRTLPQQRPTTLESKPKEPEPPKARVILSSSGPTNVPTAVPGG